MGVVSSISSSKLSGKLQRLAVVVLQIQGLKLSSRDETSSYRLSINRISGRNSTEKNSDENSSYRLCTNRIGGRNYTEKTRI